jgi:hypothetical protein
MFGIECRTGGAVRVAAANANGVQSFSPGLAQSVYPGWWDKASTPTGLNRTPATWQRPWIRVVDCVIHFNAFRVDTRRGDGSQGSPRRATLGWMIQSRWDCAADRLMRIPGHHS